MWVGYAVLVLGCDDLRNVGFRTRAHGLEARRATRLEGAKLRRSTGSLIPEPLILPHTPGSITVSVQVLGYGYKVSQPSQKV